MNVSTCTVKAGTSIVQVDTSLSKCGSDRHFCTALSTEVWKAELWKALTTNRFTKFRITDITFLSWLDSIACPASLKSRMTVSSSRAGITAICSRSVFSKRADERGYVVGIVKVGLYSDIGLSERPSNVSSPSALGVGAATSSDAASNA